ARPDLRAELRIRPGLDLPAREEGIQGIVRRGGIHDGLLPTLPRREENPSRFFEGFLSLRVSAGDDSSFRRQTVPQGPIPAIDCTAMDALLAGKQAARQATFDVPGRAGVSLFAREL